MLSPCCSTSRIGNSCAALWVQNHWFCSQKWELHDKHENETNSSIGIEHAIKNLTAWLTLIILLKSDFLLHFFPAFFCKMLFFAACKSIELSFACFESVCFARLQCFWCFLCSYSHLVHAYFCFFSSALFCKITQLRLYFLKQRFLKLLEDIASFLKLSNSKKKLDKYWNHCRNKTRTIAKDRRHRISGFSNTCFTMC